MDEDILYVAKKEVPAKKQSSRFLRYGAVALGGIFFVLLVGLMVFIRVTSMPKDFSGDEVASIPSGTSVRNTAQILKDQNLIKAPRFFEFMITLYGGGVIAGDYRFTEEQSMMRVAQRMNNGIFGDVLVRVVLPEGSTREQMADILARHLDTFEAEEFLRTTNGKEGYLFPDTYFFFPSATATTVADSLEKAFNQQIAKLEDGIKGSSLTLEEVVTLASIIEKESYDNLEERQTIAGILLKRMSIDMPLQVDATFVYILGKGSAQLTLADLATDSPYNTYTNRGLPPGPISNPGYDSLYAALNPIDSPYLFYLHGKDGIVRYARTHDEHVANKNKYLR